MVISGKYSVKKAPIGGRIGENTGKSLAEQLPKAIEQGRLASGLKDFSKNAQNQSPLEAASDLLSIPGIGAEHIYALQPLLKQLQERNSALSQGTPEESQTNNSFSGGDNTQGVSPSGSNTQKNGNILSKNEVRFDKLKQESIGNKIRTPDTVKAELSEIRDPTQNEIFNKRNEYLKTNPWMSPEAATDLANDYFRRKNAQTLSKIEQGERQVKVESDFDKEFDRLLGSDLQKKGDSTYSDVTGRFQNELRDKGYDDINFNGLTPKQAAHKWVNIGGDYARMKKRIETDSQKLNYLQNPKAVIDNITQGAKYANELNRGREFADDLVSNFDFSKPYSKDLTFPPTKNSQDYIKKIQNPYKSANLTTIAQNAGQGFIRSQKYANDLVPLITDKDSIESIAYNIKKKDPFFDERAFYDRLKDRQEDGTFRTNPLQREELSARETNLLGNLKDLWFQVLGGK